MSKCVHTLLNINYQIKAKPAHPCMLQKTGRMDIWINIHHLQSYAQLGSSEKDKLFQAQKNISKSRVCMCKVNN